MGIMVLYQVRDSKCIHTRTCVYTHIKCINTAHGKHVNQQTNASVFAVISLHTSVGLAAQPPPLFLLTLLPISPWGDSPWGPTYDLT